MTKELDYQLFLFVKNTMIHLINLLFWHASEVTPTLRNTIKLNKYYKNNINFINNDKSNILHKKYTPVNSNR